MHAFTLDTLEQQDLQNAWLTIGIFDGVHTGHQSLLRRLVDGAHAGGFPAVVLTFDPHPATVLGGRRDFKYLSTSAERLTLLDSLGVDELLIHTFTPAFASQTAEQFMRQVVHSLDMRHLVIGYDTALGHDRQGNAARLMELGQDLGYSVEVMPPILRGGKVISSTLIREQISLGNITEAAASLGHFYSLTGKVVHGDGRGRHINVPTANLDYPAEKLIPAKGIYATWAWVGDKRFLAATNIGTNPTFTPEQQISTVETHILDFHNDLYGQVIRLEFVSRLRDEMKFPTVEALLAQIADDLARTRALLQ